MRKDFQQGVRLFTADPPATIQERRSAELWRLEPARERLWVTRLPATVMDAWVAGGARIRIVRRKEAIQPWF